MHNGSSHTRNDIVRLTDIGSKTFGHVMRTLVQQKLVTRTRTNRLYHYTMDMSSSRTRCLLDFFNITLAYKFHPEY